MSSALDRILSASKGEVLAETTATEKKADNPYIKYQDDPVKFGEEVLGEQYTAEIGDLMMSVRYNVRTIAKSGNAVGKSHGMARIAVWFFRCFQDSQVYCTAAPPEDNLRRILFGEIANIVRKFPALFIDDQISIPGMRIQRHDLSFITGVAIPITGDDAMREARFSGKHAPEMLFLGDEADAIPTPVFKGIDSCMSGGFSRSCFSFNPRAAAGPMYKMIRDKQANIIEISAMTHPNVVIGPRGGKDPIPGAVTKNKTGYRILNWTRPLFVGEELDKDDVFEVPECLVDFRPVDDADGSLMPRIPAGHRKVVDPSFSYMILARFPATAENQLCDGADIDAARQRYDRYVDKRGVTPPSLVRGIGGLDVADLGKDVNSLASRYGDFLAPLDILAGVDPTKSAQHFVPIIQQKRLVRVMVDSTGVGAGSVSTMKDSGYKKAYRIMVANSPTESVEEMENGEFFQLRDQIAWAVRMWLKSGNAMLPPDEDLIEEMRAFKYYLTNKNKIKVSDKAKLYDILGRSADRFFSVALTFAPIPIDTNVGTVKVFNYAFNVRRGVRR